MLSAPLTASSTALAIALTGLHAGATAWLGFAYVAVVSMFLGFFAWYAGLARGGVARIGQVQLAQPVLTLGWSAAAARRARRGGHAADARSRCWPAWRRRSAPRDRGSPRSSMSGYPFARMAVNTNAVGKRYPPLTYAVGREKIREYAFAVGETNPLHLEVAGRARPGLSRRRRAADVRRGLRSPALGPALFDPEVGINFALMVHGGQEFNWGPLVVAGDEIETTVTVKDISERGGTGFYVFESVSTNQRGDDGVHRHLVEHRARRVSDAGRRSDPRAQGDARQVPDGALRGRLGRLQPDPHRRGLRQAGRVCRGGSCTGCGRWPRWRGRRPTPAGGPHSLRRLPVQFRGMGLPEHEITVTGTVHELRDGVAIVHTVAEQDGKAIIRNAEAEIAVE